jgi:iron complex transport system substrate-binding protein
MMRGIVSWRGALFATALLVCSTSSARVVVDPVGRTVEVPDRIERVATVGAVPVINGFIFVLGRASSLVSGLPQFVKPPRDTFQLLLAPQLEGAPSLQGQGGAPSLETLLQVRPDVVLTMETSTAESLTRRHVPAVALAWRDETDIARNIRFLGDLLGAAPRAADYLDYTDATLASVRKSLATADASSRPKALFCQCRTMTQPHRVADWWIAQAGGTSVTAGDRPTEQLTFSAEDLLRWNPDVIFAATRADIDFLRQDSRLRNVAAIRNGRLHVVPYGVHSWGHRTIEQPLMVMWAAQVLHPEAFPALRMTDEVQKFYRRFFSFSLSPAQARSILNGQAR